jgi:hypothetical protein
MPSTVPAVKDGLADYLAAQTGLREADGVQVYSATPDAANVAKEHVILGNVPTAPQGWRGLGAQRKDERPTLTCWSTVVKPGAGEDAIRAARARAYALLALVEAALKADPSAGGTIPQPRQTTVTESALEEEPVTLADGGGGRSARLRFTVEWLAHLNT